MLEQLEDFLASRAESRPRANGFEEKVREWIQANADQRAFTAVKNTEGVLELNMLDVIGRDYWTGGGITSKAVKATLDSNKDARTIKVLMNSPGGDAFEGLAIQNLLKRTGARIEFEIIGLAASAATVIAMAGDTITIHEGAMFMIHEAWTWDVGNKRDLRETASFLEKVDGSIVDIYARRTGRTADEITPLVEATTWMTAHEAVTEKFATSVIPAKSGAGNSSATKAAAAGAGRIQAKGQRRALVAVPAKVAPKNGDGPAYEVGDRIFVPEPHVSGHTVGEVREAVLTYVYGALMDGFEKDGIHHWYVESELVAEADRAAFEEPGESDDGDEMKMSARGNTGNSRKAKTMTNTDAIVPEAVDGDELTPEERDLAIKSAAEAAKNAVKNRREEERREFMATNPLARAGKPPAPPFGGLRNK